MDYGVLKKVVSNLDDLKEAISKIKGLWSKTVQKQEQDSSPLCKLQYLGKAQVNNWTLTYLLGTDKNRPRYRVEVNLEKYVNKTEPCIKLIKINQDSGKIVLLKDKIKDLKDAVNEAVKDFKQEKLNSK